MAIGNGATGSKKIVCAALCFFTALVLFAGGKKETSLEEGTNITKVGKDFVFTQVLSFPAVSGADRYDIEVAAVNDDENAKPQETITVTANRFEVHLTSGLYQYRINAFDRAGTLIGRSLWQRFEIASALQPEAGSYQPVYAFYYELNEPVRTLIIHGSELYDHSEYALLRSEKIPFDWTGIALEDRRVKKIYPESVKTSEDHTRAELTFDEDEIKSFSAPGSWDIFVRNPGGLWSRLGRIRIGFKNRVDFTVSAGWSPLFGSETSMTDWYFRMGIFPLKYKFGSFGFEISGYIQGENDIYTGLALVYQKILDQRWQFNARVGQQIFYHKDDEGISYTSIGADLQFFIWKSLYAEGGLEIAGRSGDFLFRPTLGIGWQIGRWEEFQEVVEARKKGLDPSVPVRDIPSLEWSISAGWSPAVEFSNSLLDSFNPLGAYVRPAIYPVVWGNNRVGLDAEIALLDYHNRDHSREIGGQLLDIYNCLLFHVFYQRVSGPWQFTARLGTGIAQSYAEPDVNTLEFAMDAGVLVQYFFWKGLFAEAGVTILECGNKDIFVRLYPTLGMGWQFNRGIETGIRRVK